MTSCFEALRIFEFLAFPLRSLRLCVAPSMTEYLQRRAAESAEESQNTELFFLAPELAKISADERSKLRFCGGLKVTPLWTLFPIVGRHAPFLCSSILRANFCE